MHEMALAGGVLQVIEQAAREQRFARVRTVWLEVGRLAAVEPEAMRFCFDAVVRGSVAEGARLELQVAAAEGWCLRCERAFAPEARFDPCPHCGGYEVRVEGGEQMRVTELEVD
jgi:hydrogenase nickel incorporation protein HypA/HybF